MNMTSHKGSSKLGVLFALLFFASIALNAIFISGCEIFKLGGRTVANPPTQHVTRPSDELMYLREIASMLRIDETSDKTPGDIAFDIQQCLSKSQTYRGNVLSADAFAKASSAIRIAEDQTTFKAYQDFISKIAGKKIIVLE